MMSKKNKSVGAGQDDIPLGLGMALARNTSAMERFSMLNDAQRSAVLAASSAVTSRREMQDLVQRLGEGKLPDNSSALF